MHIPAVKPYLVKNACFHVANDVLGSLDATQLKSGQKNSTSVFSLHSWRERVPNRFRVRVLLSAKSRAGRETKNSLTGAGMAAPSPKKLPPATHIMSSKTIFARKTLR